MRISNHLQNVLVEFKLVQRERIDWLDLEEPTAEELGCANELEHGDYEIYSEQLRLILDEAIFPWCPFGHASNMEFVENESPFTHQYFRHGHDSCGHGKHRDGIGMQIAYMQHHVPAVEWLSICHNSKQVTGQGLFGGYAPRTIPGVTITDPDLN